MHTSSLSNVGEATWKTGGYCWSSSKCRR